MLFRTFPASPKSSVALVLAGHVSKARISWLSADLRLPLGIDVDPITAPIYKILQYYHQLSCCSIANYSPLSPTPPIVSQDSAFWFSFESDLFLKCYIKLLNFYDICNTFMLVLFCLPWGLLLLSLLFIHARLHGCAGSSCPEQNHTANPNCILIVSYLWR